MTEHSFEEWTPEERAQLADVGQHRSPRSELKGRTMRDLRERGLLGAAGSRRAQEFSLGRMLDGYEGLLFNMSEVHASPVASV